MGSSLGRTLRALALVISSAVATPPGGRALAVDVSGWSCPPAGAAIEVLTGPRELWLCANGTTSARFPVALGRGGLGKRREGDGRTPVGTYALGAPRPSARYGTFIPIGYPTAAQSAHGFSGAAVGIHGPPRRIGAAEYPLTEIDWTLGCVAVATDEQMAAIAAFVRELRPIVIIH